MFTEYVCITPDVLWIPAYAGMTVMHRPIYSQTLGRLTCSALEHPAERKPWLEGVMNFRVLPLLWGHALKPVRGEPLRQAQDRLVEP